MIGLGSALDPYIITNEADLFAMGNDTAAYYKLSVDIALTKLWIPLRFTGTLDGRGYTISELQVDASAGADHYGFFSQLTGNADVRNLNLITNSIGIVGSGAKYGGVLAGYTANNAKARNIVAIGVVNHGGDRGGGLLGYVGAMALLESTATFVKVKPGGWENVVVSNYGSSIGAASKAGVWSSEYSGNPNPGGAGIVVVDLTTAQAADPANYPSYFDFTTEWEIAADGLPRVRKLDEVANPESEQTLYTKVAGIVQVNGAPASRTVRAYGYHELNYELEGKRVSQSQSLGQATSDPATGEYLIDLFWGYESQVFVIAFDDYGQDFTANAVLEAGDRIRPSTPNGYVWETVGAGTLPSEEPIWVVDEEASRLYGTASMIARPFYRPMVHGPILPVAYTPTFSDEHYDYLIALLNMDQQGIAGHPIINFAPNGAEPVIYGALTNQPGKFGKSLYFDGGSDYVKLPGNVVDYDIYPGQDFTIEMFAKRTAAGSGVIVGKSDGGSNSCYSIRFGINSFSFTSYYNGSGGSSNSIGSSVIVELNVWYHLAVSRSGETYRLFLDGDLVGEGTAKDPFRAAGRSLYLGRLGYPGYQYYYAGNLDEFRFTKGVARYTQAFKAPDKPFLTAAPK